MKLFGDTGKHLHAQKKGTVVPKKEQPQQNEQPQQALREPQETAASVKATAEPSGFFHAPVWKKLRIPAIVLGAIVVLLLLAVLIDSIWEEPPEIKQTDGPKVQPTIQPVTEVPKAQVTTAPTEQPAETAAPDTTPEPTAEPSAEPTAAPAKTGRRENCYTFVILVYDQAFANTDTILVGRLNAEAGTLDMVNIPRDTLVNVSWGVKKVNTILPYEKNDADRFLEHLGNLIGFTPDCYAVVNLRAVEKLVDCIGGVYYNVPRDMHYDDPSQDLYIHINKGYQLLNGENAVKVMRFRMGNDNSGYYNGDLGRIATQQDLLMTMASQFLKLGNIPNLNNAIQIFEDNVKTDLTANNIAFFVHEFLKLDKENIRFHTMPNRLTSIRGGSYLEVVLDEWIEIVDDYLNPFYQAITMDNLDILQENYGYGAISTTGEIVPITSFLDFAQYAQSTDNTSTESSGGTQSGGTE